MEYTKLGRCGLRVSRLCLGTMNFGSGTEEKEAFRIMDAALDAGINFFDTANNYGFLTGNEDVYKRQVSVILFFVTVLLSLVVLRVIREPSQEGGA